MKHAKIIITIALFMGLFSSVSFGAEATNAGWMHWTQQQFSGLYHGMINSLTGAIQIPQSISNSVNKWNDRTKIAVATAAIVSLLAVYKRQAIVEWLNDLILRPTAEQKRIREYVDAQEIPWDKNYDKTVREILNQHQ
jgi:hypothetical protein